VRRIRIERLSLNTAANAGRPKVVEVDYDYIRYFIEITGRVGSGLS
jgi:hypothetical protein